jgi:hypothetical protein
MLVMGEWLGDTTGLAEGAGVAVDRVGSRPGSTAPLILKAVESMNPFIFALGPMVCDFIILFSSLFS